MSSLVSIIIRGKNEEDWLGLCLKSISMQSYKNFEVIYVDNDSSDASIKIAKEYKVSIIKKIKKFLPGNAINIGIRASKGKYIVILSAHCIPANKYWLSQLVSSIKPKNLAGVYGRQLPLESTSSDDARDLLITFGNENRIQKKDSFFHNANSIIRREVWEKINFDNDITNIEDRDWAKKVLGIGYKIKYDASASVYHFHGLHQHNNYESFRASAVNSLIQKINEDEKNDLPEWFDISNRICPVVLYGKNINNIEAKIKKLIKCNPRVMVEDLYYYGDCDPKIKGLNFIKRRVTTKAAFNKFTLDVLGMLNKKIGFTVEAVCFIDLGYKNFISNSISINKNTVFLKGTHLSTFAFQDKGDMWISNNKKISKFGKMFDKDTSFLRVVIGQGAVMRASLIRVKGSDPKDGYTHTFRNIKYLLR
jgi:glycosyltransferase involved in cell wall biosynthesis